jgi:hypothetical protein
MLMRDHAGEVPFPFTRDVSIDVADQVRSDQVSGNLLDASTAHQITQPAIASPLRCAARGCVPSSTVALRALPNGAAWSGHQDLNLRQPIDPTRCRSDSFGHAAQEMLTRAGRF